jgi:hypothetical protein
MPAHQDESGSFEPTGRVPLPEGVSEDAWNQEKVRVQNPRIRAFLVCIKRLEGARESNYAILHASPSRVLEVLRVVQEVAHTVRTSLAPLLRARSVIPELEVARESAEMYLHTVEKEVLAEIDKFKGHIRESKLVEVRRVLCVAIGKLHAFLVDAQAQLLAADPRNTQDAESFLARKVPRDVEEAEWLYASVLRLAVFVEELETTRQASLGRPAAELARAKKLPDTSGPSATTAYLDTLRDKLIPRLRDTLNLKGIRVSEIESIEAQTTRILAECVIAEELAALGQRLRAEAPGSTEAEAVLATRLGEILASLDRRMRDLGAFIAVWERGVAQRRALFLKKQIALREGARSQSGPEKT